MWYILKGLYLQAKLSKYNRRIIDCTKERTKLKCRQLKYTKKFEKYTSALVDHNKVGYYD